MNSMEHSLNWEDSSSLANQEFPRIFWNSKIHYRVYKSPQFVFQFVFNLSQINPSHVHRTEIFNTHFNINPQSTTRSFNWSLFPQVSVPKTLCVPLLISIRATCPAHHILLDLVALIFGEEWKWRSEQIIAVSKEQFIAVTLFSFCAFVSWTWTTLPFFLAFSDTLF